MPLKINSEPVGHSCTPQRVYVTTDVGDDFKAVNSFSNAVICCCKEEIVEPVNGLSWCFFFSKKNAMPRRDNELN